MSVNTVNNGSIMNTVRSPFADRDNNAYSYFPNPPSAATTVTVNPKFVDRRCCKELCGCFFSLVLLLCLAFIFCLYAPFFGLLLSALAPALVILIFVRRYYINQVTIGQMTVSFLEAILWMIPLIIWDIFWLLAIQTHMGTVGVCPTCILSYFLNSYFVAGFCEELLKYCVISRLQISLLAPDYRCLMVYGICAGAGFATMENILYVFGSNFTTAIFRAYTAVPLHCLTGALIGLGLSRQRTLGLHTPFWKIMLVPVLLHGTYDFLLTLGDAIPPFSIPSFVLWVLLYISGLLYARRQAVEYCKASPFPVNIHLAILHDDPPILGQPRISQWGSDPNGVCECCSCCFCCCLSRPNPPRTAAALPPRNTLPTAPAVFSSTPVPSAPMAQSSWGPAPVVVKGQLVSTPSSPSVFV